jgi:hypothetical protein
MAPLASGTTVSIRVVGGTYEKGCRCLVRFKEINEKLCVVPFFSNHVSEHCTCMLLLWLI